MIKNCKNSKLQEYQCQVCAKPWFSPKKFVCFDYCLANELFYLWSLHIKTIGSCCGKHSNCKIDGYIQVANKDINQMLALGYIPISEKLFNCFRPKTKL